MKKTITLLALVFSIVTFAQVPQGISYQAIALNSSGNPVVSSNVGVRLSVLDNSVTGTVLYTETHSKTTNAQGLFNLIIGQGTPSTGIFSTINWGTNSKFLKVEMDVAGGANYALVGTTQLLSVPYALYAETVKSIAGNEDINDEIISNQYSNLCFSTDGMSGSTTYAFNEITSTWTSQSGSGTIYESNGNFCFSTVGMSGSTTYAFNKKTNSWISQTGSGTIIASHGNFCFSTGGMSGSTTYAFNQNTNNWVPQEGSGSITASNGNFCFSTGGMSGSTTYAFNKTTGNWIAQSGAGTITASNGNFCFSTSGMSGSTTYAFSKKTGTWVAQNGAGTIITSPSN